MNEWLDLIGVAQKHNLKRSGVGCAVKQRITCEQLTEYRHVEFRNAQARTQRLSACNKGSIKAKESGSSDGVNGVEVF